MGAAQVCSSLNFSFKRDMQKNSHGVVRHQAIARALIFLYSLMLKI